MTAVSTETAIYWGAGGEYGPFHEQQTGEWAGWPNFGEVMRYFREKAKMTSEEFAKTYGELTTKDGAPITKRQVRRMELENEVPIDINKRKLIARLLAIPPMLFGLAVLEAALNAAKKPGAALKELNTSEVLHPIGKDLTREQAWLDTVAANALMGLEQFGEATRRAKRALVASQDINFVTNLAKVVDIHGQLLRSAYKDESDVEELGDMIRETLTKRIKQQKE